MKDRLCEFHKQKVAADFEIDLVCSGEDASKLKKVALGLSIRSCMTYSQAVKVVIDDFNRHFFKEVVIDDFLPLLFSKK